MLTLDNIPRKGLGDLLIIWSRTNLKKNYSFFKKIFNSNLRKNHFMDDKKLLFMF